MILKNSFILAFFSILSLLLAILRDRLLATYVGVGPVLDIYNASFRIPDLIYGTMLAFITSATVVPFLTKENKNGEIVDPRHKLASIASFFLIFMGVLALVCALLLPLFAHTIVPGFTEEQVSVFITTTRLVLIQPIILGLTSLISCLAQLKNQFLLYGLSPLGYSLGIIIGIVAFYPLHGIMGLMYGVVLGTLISFGIQAFALRGAHLRSAFNYTSFHHVRQLARLAIPRTGTNIVTQLRLLFFHGFATTLGPGVLSAYLFAQKINDAFVQVIQQSVTTASVPVLSKDVVEDKIVDYMGTVKKYVTILGVAGIAVALGLYVGGDLIIYLLYGDTGSNGLIEFFLFGFIISLPFQMMSGYYSVSLYSAKDSAAVFTTYLLSSFLGVGTVLLSQETGFSSLVYGLIVFWVTNFLIILSLYSRKKFQ